MAVAAVTLDALVSTFLARVGAGIAAWTDGALTRLTALPTRDGQFLSTPAALVKVTALDAPWRRTWAVMWTPLQADAWTAAFRALNPGRDNALLQSFLHVQAASLDREATAVVGTLSRMAYVAVAGGQAVDETALEIREATRAVLPRLRTLYDTALGMAAQLVTLDGPVRPTTPFLYAGPVDTRCRRWCLQRVGRVYTKRAIDQMDNRQLPHTFLTRGGYNCRHRWTDVSGTAAEALADTGTPAQPVVAATAQALLATVGRRPLAGLR